MANSSLNTTNAIRQQVYGQIVQKTLDDDYLADGFMRDISGDFSQGDTYNMPTVGDLVARTYDPAAAESQEVEFDALDTGRITLTINKYDGVAWYETKKLKEDDPELVSLVLAVGGNPLPDTWEIELTEDALGGVDAWT